MTFQLPLFIQMVLIYLLALFVPSIGFWGRYTNRRFLLPLATVCAYVGPAIFLLVAHLFRKPELTLIITMSFGLIGYLRLFRGGNFVKESLLSKTLLTSFLMNSFVAILLWLIFSYPGADNGRFYEDIWWNISIMGELKQHFPPIFPMWADDQSTFLYHYFPNLILAGYSWISRIPVAELTLFYFTPLVWFSCCQIFIGSVSNINRWLVKAFSLLFVALSLNYSWTTLISFYLHLAHAASNFFWGLPIFLFAVLLWLKTLAIRMRFGLYPLRVQIMILATTFILMVLLYLTKSSTALFIAIADVSLIILSSFGPQKFKIRRDGYWKTVMSLCISSIVTVIPSLFFPSSRNLAFAGAIVRNKLQGLEQNTFLTILLFVLFPFCIFVFRRDNKWNTLIFRTVLLASIFLMSLYFKISHPTFSEFYLIFDVIIAGISILAFIPQITWLRWVPLFFGITVAIASSLIPYNFVAFNTKGLLNIVNSSWSAISTRSPIIIDLVRIRSFVDSSPDGAILNLATNCQKPVVSSVLEKRTFLECPFKIEPGTYQMINRKKLETIAEIDNDHISCPSFVKHYDADYIITLKSKGEIKRKGLCDNVLIFEGEYLALFAKASQNE